MVLVLGALLWGLVSGCAHSERSAIKALPHYLDAQGRHTLSPDLFQRDAYQEYLRVNPDAVSTLRYDARWGRFATRQGPDQIRLELRGTRDGLPTESNVLVAVDEVRRGGGWVSIALAPEEYAALGRVVAWRMIALEDGQEVARARSFLWPEGARFAQPSDIQ